jgi:hypothetical protein
MRQFVPKHIYDLMCEKGYNNPTLKDVFYFLNPNNLDANAPDSATWTELINWIFIDGKIGNTFAAIDHLEFWYNTLLPELIDMKRWQPNVTGEELENNKYYMIPINEFVHEGFIGMLINWFEENGYDILVIPMYKKEVKEYCVSFKSNKGYVDFLKENGKIAYFENAKLARHSGILRIFELLKENENIN